LSRETGIRNLMGLCFFGVSRGDSHKAFEALSGREQANDYQVTDENDLPKSIEFASVPYRDTSSIMSLWPSWFHFLHQAIRIFEFKIARPHKV